MTDQTNAPREGSRSGFSRSAAAPVSTSSDSRSTGGSSVQRSHLKDRKRWLRGRVRAGKSWAERKNASLTYCPAKRAA